MEDKLNLSIQFLKTVGEVKSRVLNGLDIYTVRDLVEHFPRSYEDRTKTTTIADFEDYENALVIAKVTSPVKVQRVRKNLDIISTVLSDDTDSCKATWFNQRYIKERLIEGNTYLFYGKVNLDFNKKSIDNPVIYNVTELEKIQGIYPIYPLTSKITQNYLFKLMNIAYEGIGEFEEIFSNSFREKYNIADINSSMKNIHFPKSFGELENARNRLIFEELFLLQIALMSIKNSTLGLKKTTKFLDVDVREFLDLLPFELTNAQKKVVEEIKQDMTSEKIMNRLVQGDVGSGKTIVAATSIYIAVKSGYQASLMAPTTILANQHYEELKGYFDKLAITSEIITSTTTKKNKKHILERLKNGEIDVLIGTHSLIEDDIEFKNLGLVVTDEQHRFGVAQRLKLTNKASSVETLVMTATPIPRTLAIILYGDLDLSIIDEMPAGRKPVKTFAVNDVYNERVNIFIEKEIKKGRQVYVVCPLVEENEELNLNSVEKIYKEYKEDIFPIYNVAYLHGKMKNKQKDEIMKEFKDGKIDILISTTVIEVGISVGNATLMVIENADRFGLAALHQLRGRVGRSDKESFCILKSNNRSENAVQRLKIMEKSNSGFEIATKDLELRGPGDFFGMRQSGLPEFKIANLLKDIEVLKKTQTAAKDTILDDKYLEKDINNGIKKELFRKFGEQLKNIGT